MYVMQMINRSRFHPSMAEISKYARIGWVIGDLIVEARGVPQEFPAGREMPP
jgi:hypothetical protein